MRGTYQVVQINAEKIRNFFSKLKIGAALSALIHTYSAAGHAKSSSKFGLSKMGLFP